MGHSCQLHGDPHKQQMARPRTTGCRNTNTEHRKGTSQGRNIILSCRGHCIRGELHFQDNWGWSVIGTQWKTATVWCALAKACAGVSKSRFLKRLSSNTRKSHLQRKDSLFTHMRLRVSLGLHSYSMTEKGLPHWQWSLLW